jgi:hypothetical protein
MGCWKMGKARYIQNILGQWQNDLEAFGMLVV